MSKHDEPKPEHDAERLQDLGRRLREREAAQAAKDGQKRHETMGALGAAWRMSMELVAALVVGGLLGLGLDRVFHTAPWIMVIGLMFGFAAGVRNAVRTAYKMQVPPTGSALPEDDLGDDE